MPNRFIDKHRRLLLPLLVFLLCLLVYALLHVIFVNREDVSTTDGDEVHYLVSTESLITDHDLSPMNNYIDFIYIRHDYYQQIIHVPMLVPGANGRVVSNHLPLLPILLVPGFWLFGYNGAAMTIVILFSLAAMFVFLILRKFTAERTALIATLVFFLTYPAVTYSRLIYPETVAVFLLAVAVWASLCLREGGGWWYAAIAGVAAALVFQFHNKFIVITLALAFLIWACSKSKLRDLTAWLVPVGASLVILLCLTVYLYGTDLVHSFTISAGPGDILGGAPFWGVFGLYLDRAWGLFIFAPLYFAFIPGIPMARSKRELSRWWLFIPMVILLVTIVSGFFGQWFGGTAPVPRYLVPLIPVFVICAGLFYERCRSRFAKIALVVLLAFQAVITVFALIYPLNAFAIFGEQNGLIPKILGNNWLSRTIPRLFPLFHPVRFKSGILLLSAWLILLVGVTVYLRKKLMGPLSTRLDMVGGPS